MLRHLRHAQHLRTAEPGLQPLDPMPPTPQAFQDALGNQSIAFVKYLRKNRLLPAPVK
jgi:hypothetical protein